MQATTINLQQPITPVVDVSYIVDYEDYEFSLRPAALGEANFTAITGGEDAQYYAEELQAEFNAHIVNARDQRYREDYNAWTIADLEVDYAEQAIEQAAEMIRDNPDTAAATAQQRKEAVYAKALDSIPRASEFDWHGEAFINVESHTVDAGDTIADIEAEIGINYVSEDIEFNLTNELAEATARQEFAIAVQVIANEIRTRAYDDGIELDTSEWS